MSRLQGRITELYASFSPQERRAADALLEHLPKLATYRAAELAELAGVSRATMSRFVRRLGFEDFEDFRDELRSVGVPVVGREASAGLAEWAEAEIAVLRRAFEGVDIALLDAAADAIGRARRVVVIGRRTSYPVALHLRQQLIQIRDQVTVAPAPGQTLAEDLVDLRSDDVVVLVATRRRSEGTSRLVELLSERQVPVLLVADPSAAGLAAESTWWLTTPLATHGAFDGYAAAMALVSLLADRVGRMTGDGWQHARDIDADYHQLQEIEP